jgi:hypothetical protein
LRSNNLQTKTVYFFLKTQTFRYAGFEIRFDSPITSPSDIMKKVEENIDRVYKPNTDYRATGIILHAISPDSVHQSDLFNLHQESSKRSLLYTTLDKLNTKQGRAAVFLASSLRAHLSRISKQKILPQTSTIETCLRLGFPYWGEGV